jgi:hypothetical protein
MVMVNLILKVGINVFFFTKIQSDFLLENRRKMNLYFQSLIVISLRRESLTRKTIGEFQPYIYHILPNGQMEGIDADWENEEYFRKNGKCKVYVNHLTHHVDFSRLNLKLYLENMNDFISFEIETNDKFFGEIEIQEEETTSSGYPLPSIMVEHINLNLRGRNYFLRWFCTP